MSLTLTQYRTRIAELLDDTSGARYTSNQIDDALRLALNDYSTIRPIKRTYMLDTSDDRVMTLPADFAAVHITRVQKYSSDPNLMTDYDFIARLVDEQWTVEVPGMIFPAGYYLVVTYAARHSIDGFDSASGTTIDDDNLLCLGAAGYAAQTRAVSRAETINMQPQVQRQLLDMANQYLGQFFGRLPQSKGITAAAFGDMPADKSYTPKR